MNSKREFLSGCQSPLDAPEQVVHSLMHLLTNEEIEFTYKPTHLGEGENESTDRTSDK